MNKKVAEEIVEAGDGVLNAISLLLDIVNQELCEPEKKSMHLGIGAAIAGIDLEVLERVYKEFPDLRPDKLCSRRLG